MRTVAITGAGQPVGKALLERLDADRTVERIVAVGEDPPDMPVAKLRTRVCPLTDRHLADALAGADVVVHTALDPVPSRDAEAGFVRNVQATRNLLDAVAKVGATRFVHLSSAAVYGAHPDNPLPLTEDAPLRANPDYPPAYHALLAEELVGEFATGHPETAVVVLRAATPLGHGADSPIAQHLDGPRLTVVEGSQAPLQFVHVDDLAAALHLAATGDVRGVYNVAADGWLATDELATVLGKRRLAVPEVVAFAAVHWLWERGLWPVPAGMLRFLQYPTVVSAGRLREAGWAPTRTNREVVRERVAEQAGTVRFGPVRLRRRTTLLAVTGAGAGAGALVLAGRRRSRQSHRSRRS